MFTLYVQEYLIRKQLVKNWINKQFPFYNFQISVLSNLKMQFIHTMHIYFNLFVFSYMSFSRPVVC